VIIQNENGHILIGKRLNSHAPFYSIPGGGLEMGESFEEGAIREVKEETNLDIVNPKVICVTNNLETYKNEGVHYISVVLVARCFTGDVCLMEPGKCESWEWVDPKNLPTPHFDASEMAIDCYLSGKFYVPRVVRG